MKEIKQIHEKISRESGISWIKTYKTIQDGRMIPDIVQKLMQFGPLVVTEVKRAGNMVHYKVDAKLENKVAHEMSVFMEGMRKGLQLKP